MNIKTIFKGAQFHYCLSNYANHFNIWQHLPIDSDDNVIINFLHSNIGTVLRIKSYSNPRITLASEIKKQIADDYNRATQK